nr:PREDICTED: TBC1 domain family member 23 [Bemisia tabaci]
MAIWDVYFQQTDPFFLFFLALVIIVNARDEIFQVSTSKSKEELLEIIRLLPCNLRTEDVEDFCSLAYYYNTRTPDSYKTELRGTLFGDSCPENYEPNKVISQALCLPVSPMELITKSALPNVPASTQQVRFFLIDCRPVQQYNAGHLPTAFHLDSNLMLQEPITFATAVQGLLSAQQQAIAAGNNAGGEHLCFLGCGQLEDDQYTHMVVASFLQKHTPFVCMVNGGYKAIHEYLDLSVDISLQDHSSDKCLVCCDKINSMNSPKKETKVKSEPGSSGPSSSNSSSDLFGKIGAAMKQASSEMKGKLLDYIVNPTGESKSENSEKSFSGPNKHGKPYRNLAPVFSIDDEDDPTDGGSIDLEQTQDYVSLTEWKRKPDVIAYYRCRSLKPNESQKKYVDMYGCYLFITKTHIYALREIESNPEMAHIVVKRPLASISRILNRVKHPNIITLKYCSIESESSDETDMDRFFIPDYKEATQVLSKQILKCVQRQKAKTSKNQLEED